MENLISEAVDFTRFNKYTEPGYVLKDMYATEYKRTLQKGWLKG